MKYPILVISILIVISAVMVYGIHRKLSQKKETRAKIQMLPPMHLYKMDSTTFQFSDSSSTVVIFFNSECDHCQYELKEICKNAQLFERTELVIISSENIAIIRKVSDDFGAGNLPGIHFVKINPGELFNAFGSVSVPHIFIYSKDQKLVKEFNGETRVEVIVKYIP